MNEFFSFPDGPDGKAIHLDVASLRAWAEANLTVKNIVIDAVLVKSLVDGGTVDLDKAQLAMASGYPKPIIICRQFTNDGRDRIVDGNHTYVARALITAAVGLFSPGETCCEGFVVEHDQWSAFAISPERAKALRLPHAD
jgi:hypothetical protein